MVWGGGEGHPPSWMHLKKKKCLQIFSHTDDLSSSGVVSYSAMSNSLLSMDRGAWPWNSPGKNTGVGCHFLLQVIFPTQRSDPDPLHCGQSLGCLSHRGGLGAPFILVSRMEFRETQCFLKGDSLTWNPQLY